MKNFPFVSVVIPIFNEEENLSELDNRLHKTLQIYEKYEVVFVNDGSHDRSFEIIKEFQKGNKNYKILDFSRNFGHQAAITAGINFSKGDVVIVMDGDLQDPPEQIPIFVEKWQEGYDVVYAVREKRKENFLKRMAYFTFYRILDHMSEFPIPLDSGDFGLIDRKIADLLKQLPEKNRYVRGLRAWLGFKQIGITYERDSRFAGTPKYTFRSLIKLASDGIISFSDYPLKLSIKFGFLVSSFSFFCHNNNFYPESFDNIRC